jgi:hypothetical protein
MADVGAQANRRIGGEGRGLGFLYAESDRAKTRGTETPSTDGETVRMHRPTLMKGSSGERASGEAAI